MIQTFFLVRTLAYYLASTSMSVPQDRYIRLNFHMHKSKKIPDCAKLLMACSGNIEIGWVNLQMGQIHRKIGTYIQENVPGDFLLKRFI